MLRQLMHEGDGHAEGAARERADRRVEIARRRLVQREKPSPVFGVPLVLSRRLSHEQKARERGGRFRAPPSLPSLLDSGLMRPGPSCSDRRPRINRTLRDRTGRMLRLGKLGVTGSSPVPPIKNACKDQFFVCRCDDMAAADGNASRSVGAATPVYASRSSRSAWQRPRCSLPFASVRSGSSSRRRHMRRRLRTEE